MQYNVNLPIFEGPLDLLLHLIKQSNIDIFDININEITKQYLNYINKMQEMNLNIASEYLVMAAELIEMKSRNLLPNNEEEQTELEEEIDPRQNLINRLIEYQKYKGMTKDFKDLEEKRKEFFTKDPDSLKEYQTEFENIDYNVTLDDLLNAFSKFLKEKELEKPLNTKITSKDYSVAKRSTEIRDLIRIKKEVDFTDLFNIVTKEYVVVTFLAILNMTKNQEIVIEQNNNFNSIIIKERKNNESSN